MRHIIILLAVFLAASCAFAAEPHRVLFDRIGPKETALFVAKADGTEERPLLAAGGGLDYDPAYSPDGAWIVFTSERDGSAELYRVKVDGTDLERLTDHPAYDDQAAFSSDGRQIVFVSSRDGGWANLWILDVATHKEKRLTSGKWGDFRPAWSPDGNWIAFSSDRDTPFQFAAGRWEQLHLLDVYVIRPDGTGLRRLTQPGGFCGSPKWSRDSRRLVAYCMTAEESFGTRMIGPRGESRLVSMEVATGTVADISAGPGVKIAPAFVGSDAVGYVRKDTRDPGIFYSDGNAGPRGILRSPSWSPDGSRVVYHRILAIRAPDWQKTWSRDPEFELILTHELPAFHPSGDRFVVTQTPGREALSLIETETGNSRILYQQADEMLMAAQWSPRGDAVVFGLGTFFVQRAQGAQVALVNADGSGFRQLTRGANNNGFPSYSSDGRQIVYRTVGPEGQGLRVMNLEDNSVRALTTDYDNFPLWSPRGDRIVFTRKHEGDFELFTIRPDGTDLRRLTFAPGNEAHCAWSPDGEWLLFSSSRVGFKDEAVYSDSPQPYGELFVMRYDGTEARQLTDNQWEDATPAWQPSPAKSTSR